MSALLAFAHLRKAHGNRVLLDLDAFAFDAGLTYVITGGNGVGKSTLLRALAGLEPAEIEGLRFKGAAVTAAAARQRMVYVHQHPYMFHTSVAANIAYGLKARKVAAAERQRRVDAAIAWAQVGALRALPPHTLSGGEKQRVALARAKVLAPELYLLDEPTANLDGEGRRLVIDLVQQLARDGAGVMIACHDRELIELPDVRRYHLEGGKLSAIV